MSAQEELAALREANRLLRLAVIGLLGVAQEYHDAVGPCDHASGHCRCRMAARMAEAENALHGL